jgi:hypothetical protein
MKDTLSVSIELPNNKQWIYLSERRASGNRWSKFAPGAYRWSAGMEIKSLPSGYRWSVELPPYERRSGVARSLEEAKTRIAQYVATCNRDEEQSPLQRAARWLQQQVNRWLSAWNERRYSGVR